MSRERDEHMSTADFLEAGESRHRERDTTRGAQGNEVYQLDEHDRVLRQETPAERMQQPSGAMRDMPHEPARAMEAPHMEDGRPLESRQPARSGAGEQLEALFDAHAAQEFRSRWSEVQIGFVDDPHQAVRQADELVAQVMRSLAECFARQRQGIEAGVPKEGGEVSTEELRVALRRYRSFFERLLSL
jgi:hypothetical protein